MLIGQRYLYQVVGDLLYIAHFGNISYYECMCPNKILLSYVVVVSGGLCVVTVIESRH